MNAMWKQTLWLQWKTLRWALVPFVLACFGLPLLAVRQARAASLRTPFGDAEAIIQSLQLWLPLFPITAAMLGATLGLMAWSLDHRANHVYALALPVARWEYALLKFGAGVVMLAIPVAAVLAGLLIGLVGMEVPASLNVYPFGFTLRFLLAAVIVYATTFALAAGTKKTTIWILSGSMFVLIFGTLAVEFIGEAFGLEGLRTPLDIIYTALSQWPGPFHVFGGNWMPIDV